MNEVECCVQVLVAYVAHAQQKMARSCHEGFRRSGLLSQNQSLKSKHVGPCARAVDGHNLSNRHTHSDSTIAWQTLAPAYPLTDRRRLADGDSSAADLCLTSSARTPRNAEGKLAAAEREHKSDSMPPPICSR